MTSVIFFWLILTTQINLLPTTSHHWPRDLGMLGIMAGTILPAPIVWDLI